MFQLPRTVHTKAATSLVPRHNPRDPCSTYLQVEEKANSSTVANIKSYSKSTAFSSLSCSRKKKGSNFVFRQRAFLYLDTVALGMTFIHFMCPKIHFKRSLHPPDRCENLYKDLC